MALFWWGCPGRIALTGPSSLAFNISASTASAVTGAGCCWSSSWSVMVSSGSRKEQVLWREIGRPAPRARSPPARRAATTPTPTTHRQGGWIFTQPSSKLLDPRRDWDKWKNILREAEVRDAPGYTTRGTRPQPCCSCSASRTGGDGLHGMVINSDDGAPHARPRRAPSRCRGPTQRVLLTEA